MMRKIIITVLSLLFLATLSFASDHNKTFRDRHRQRCKQKRIEYILRYRIDKPRKRAARVTAPKTRHHRASRMRKCR